MIYDIYFDAKAGMWRISITHYYLLFIAITRVVRASNTATGKPNEYMAPLDFDTFANAEEHAARIGLGQAYMRRQRQTGIFGAFNTIAANAKS